MSNYDCTSDVQEHCRKVRYWMADFISQLQSRAESHDTSKLASPEKSIFDEWTPKLKSIPFGTDEYKAALVSMGDGLQAHYKSNRHHPEHFPNGINDMTLVDLVEMFCDWLAASEAKQTPFDYGILGKRFKLEPQLIDIFTATTRDIDFWCELNGVPVTYFTPVEKRLPSGDGVGEAVKG